MFFKVNNFIDNKKLLSDKGNMKKIGGGILAAGQSKRFGEPKQLLKWGDTTILGKVVKEFKKAKFNKTYIVLGAYYKKILKKLLSEFTDCKILFNNNWKHGMFTSIKKIVEKAIEDNLDYILIHQADMPFINSRILNLFIQNSLTSSSELIIGTFENKPSHPYVLSKKLFNEVLNLNGEEGIRPIIRKYFESSTKIKVPYLIGKQDIDTWQDYWRLKNGI